MQKFRYVGVFDEVEVAHLGALYGPVAQGDTIDLPDDVAAGLAGQDVWEPVTAAKKAAAKKDEVEP